MNHEYDPIQDADQCVYDYIQKELAEAYLRVEKERCGMGCGCIQCAHAAVNSINSWVSWISVDEDMWNKHRYQIATLPNGAWKILAPGEEC